MIRPGGPLSTLQQETGDSMTEKKQLGLSSALAAGPVSKDGDRITTPLLALRSRLVAEHPDSLFIAWQGVRQMRYASVSKGEARIFEAMDALLSAAYEAQESPERRVAVG